MPKLVDLLAPPAACFSRLTPVRPRLQPGLANRTIHVLLSRLQPASPARAEAVDKSRLKPAGRITIASRVARAKATGLTRASRLKPPQGFGECRGRNGVYTSTCNRNPRSARSVSDSVEKIVPRVHLFRKRWHLISAENDAANRCQTSNSSVRSDSNNLIWLSGVSEVLSQSSSQRPV